MLSFEVIEALEFLLGGVVGQVGGWLQLAQVSKLEPSETPWRHRAPKIKTGCRVKEKTLSSFKS